MTEAKKRTGLPLDEGQALVFALLPAEVDGGVTAGVGVVEARLLLSLVLLREPADGPHDGRRLVFEDLVVVRVRRRRQGLAVDDLRYAVVAFVALDLVAAHAT